MKRSIILAALIFSILTAGTADAAPIEVFVSILPQKHFVTKIGGRLIDVSVMVEPGANPHSYEPKPRQMVGLTRARAYFAIGVPFERVWLKKIAAANNRMLIVHTEEGIKRRPMKSLEDHHGETGRHGILDPHVWTSPPLVKILAGNIFRGLVSVDEAHRAAYQANHKKFIAEIDELDAELKSIFAGKRGVRFMVFHPAWGYFAEAYGLEQVPIEMEGKEPKPAQLKKLIEQARGRGIKVVFVQPQTSTKSAQIIARAIGGQVVFADPLAEDWGHNLREQAARFRAALK